MSKYVELPIDMIELDKSNPRIANYLATHDEKDIVKYLSMPDKLIAARGKFSEKSRGHKDDTEDT